MSTPGTAPKKILVVDDEPFVCETVKLLLAFDGHEVVTALNGEEALKQFQTAPFDLVITDYSMPAMKGDELGVKLKTLKPGQPVVLITAYAEMLRGDGAPIPGVDYLISKPFLLEHLREAIARTTGNAGPVAAAK
jgi:CheY-like chemotaxis protein